jgi:antitoxin component HigA of HigAB toxin-antitoxin module
MITQIENKEQYEHALARIYTLMQMDNPVATPLLEELKALSILVEKYEKEHYPMLKP